MVQGIRSIRILHRYSISAANQPSHFYSISAAYHQEFTSVKYKTKRIIDSFRSKRHRTIINGFRSVRHETSSYKNICSNNAASFVFNHCGFPIQYQRHESFSNKAAFHIQTKRHFIFKQSGISYSNKAAYFFPSQRIFILKQSGIFFSI